MLRALAPYARRARQPVAGDRCELCAAPLPETHPHVVDLEERSICCACGPCGILFREPGAGARFRTVPGRVLVDPDLTLDAAGLAEVGVPVGLAFLMRPRGRWMALYPSPAGPTEAEVDPAGLEALAARTPLVAAVTPDVEALLVYGRRGQEHVEAFVVGVDVGYDLVGRVRRLWRGFDGGDEVRAEIEAVFDRLRGRAWPVGAIR